MSDFSYIPVTEEDKKPEPTVYPIDARKASLEEMGLLFNVLGIACTEAFAKEHGIEHLIQK